MWYCTLKITDQTLSGVRESRIAGQRVQPVMYLQAILMKAHHLIQLHNVIVGGGRQRQSVIVLGHIWIALEHVCFALQVKAERKAKYHT